MTKAATIEIFRAGTHVDSRGRSHTYTEADLDKIAAGYDPARHEAPVTIGHPKDNSPAYGWVSKLRRRGKVLEADLVNLADGLIGAVRAGRYKKRSASFYPDGSLRHVGFLGGMPPAVKGLADVSFNDDDGAVTFDFADRRWADLRNIVGRLRDFIIDKFSMEDADRVLPSWLADEVLQDDDQPSAAFAEPTEPDKQTEEEPMPGEAELKDRLSKLEVQFSEQAAETQATRDENEKLKAEVAQLKGEKTAAENKQRLTETAAFCEGLVEAGKLTPKQRRAAEGILNSLKADQVAEFAEGDNMPAVQAMKEFLEGLPVNDDLLKEVASKAKAADRKAEAGAEFGESVDQERLELHTKATALAEEKGISYSEAIALARKEG